MIHALDAEACLDPRRAGSKAAWLARGRQAGLPVVPGVVLDAGVSRTHLADGATALAASGSGAARMAVTGASLGASLLDELIARVAPLGEPLVVRSSSVLEGSGEWSGAFSSYVEVYRSELASAVLGCWASQFTVAALGRFSASGIDPGVPPMAVLIQPALRPDFGGTAFLSDGTATVTGVRGSPAPLVAGHEPGVRARVGSSGVQGAEAVALLGAGTIARVAEVLGEAHESIGATGCEWAAVDGEVILLQLMRSPRVAVVEEGGLGRLPGGEPLASLARLIRRHPGPLGESHVLPWAVADAAAHLDPVDPAALAPAEALRQASAHAVALAAEVWGTPPDEARSEAAGSLRALRGLDPLQVIERFTALGRPDPERGRLVRSLLASALRGLAAAGAVTAPELGWYIARDRAVAILEGTAPVEAQQRFGFDRWEPFTAAAVMAEGRGVAGIGAAPGVGSGRLCWIAGDPGAADFRPRDVVVASHAVPNLAPLLWDAAAVVTTGGSPGAHLFESARALAIPAVCGVHLDDVLGGSPRTATGKFALAVDGTAATVFVSSW